MAAPLAYTAEELGPMLGVTPRHVRRLGREGVIPAMALGARIVFPKDAVDRWLNDPANLLGKAAAS